MPTAREKANHLLVLRNLQAGPKVLTVTGLFEFVQQGMTNVFDQDILTVIKSRLKWEYGCKGVNDSSDFLDPATTPGPDLRTDIVKNRDTGFFSLASQPQIKFGEIYQDQSIRFVAAVELSLKLIESVQYHRKMTNYLNDAHDCQFFTWNQDLATLRCHILAADAKKICIRQLSSNSTHQF